MPKRKKVSSTPDKLECKKCKRSIDVPLCCGDETLLEKGMLACEYCGKTRKVPVCCGKKMTFIIKE